MRTHSESHAISETFWESAEDSGRPWDVVEYWAQPGNYGWGSTLAFERKSAKLEY